MVFPRWLNSQIDSIKEIGCGVNTRAAIESVILWSLNLAEASPCDFGSAKASQLAVNYACDVTTIPEKLGNFFPRAN
jgi:hypothetical protein